MTYEERAEAIAEEKNEQKQIEKHFEKLNRERLEEQLSDALSENAELKTQNEWLEDCKSELAEFLGKANDRIAGLEQQIEKMKNCCNCDWSKYLPNGNCLDCGKGLKNWKLKE